MARLFATLCVVVIALAGFTMSNGAQAAQTTSCPTFIADALNAVGDNCQGLNRNNACYGFTDVLATFQETVPENTFTQPADVANLFNIASIATSPLRRAENTWGISLMSVQANLPESLPGQNVIFMLAGDVEVENGVSNAEATAENATETPMQVFYFRTNITGTECVGAPDTLIAQGPQNVQVDFRANGADIRIGSTVALRTLTISQAGAQGLAQRFSLADVVDGLMELTVLDGQAILYPGTPDEQIINEGERGFTCLGEPGNLGLDGMDNDSEPVEGCPWFDIAALTPEQWAEFGFYDGTLLNYPIDIPEFLTATPTSTRAVGGGVLLPTLAPTNTSVPPTSVPATTVPVTSAPVTLTPTFTPTLTFTPTPNFTPTPTFTPTNTPPTLILNTPLQPVARDSFLLTGSYSDPDAADVLTLDIDWGDVNSDTIILGGGGGLDAPAASGNFSIPHSYAQNGVYTVSASLSDGSISTSASPVTAEADPLYPLGIETAGGDGQSALPNEAFTDPIRFQLNDAGGAPVRDFPVYASLSGVPVTLSCNPCETDETGASSAMVTAGGIPGFAEVGFEASGVASSDVDLPAADVALFTLEVIDLVDDLPTVVITNTETEITNGAPFNLNYTTSDVDDTELDVTVNFGDGTVLPLGILGVGPATVSHEFGRVDTLTITVTVVDGTSTVTSAPYVLVVKPVYPLKLSQAPATGWTGVALTGATYPGLLQVSVADATSDPVANAALSHIDGGSLSGSLVTGADGSALIGVGADCLPRSSFRIGTPDPLGPTTAPGLGTVSSVSVPVTQLIAYNLPKTAGDEQVAFEGDFFEVLPTVQLLDHTGASVADQPVTFTIASTAGAVFDSGTTITPATTDSGGFASSDEVIAGTAEFFFIEARYNYGACSVATTFTLETQVDLGSGPAPDVEVAPAVDSEVTAEPTAELGPEATAEATVSPEAAAEATPAPEATAEATAIVVARR